MENENVMEVMYKIGQKRGTIVSGGNIDVTILSRVINRGLLQAGRLVDLTIEMTDKPGQLNDVSRIIADLGANVVSVNHNRSDVNMDINSCFLKISLETRDYNHIQEIENKLRDAGYKLV